MIEVRPGEFYQKYPIGYPLLVAAGYLLGGESGAFLVNPVLGVLCILGTMLLARELFGPWTAIVAGACIALCPAVLFQSVSAVSHISDTCFVVFGLWILWKWGQSGRGAYSLLAGFLIGFAVSIRNTEALLIANVAWVVVLRCQSLPRDLRWKHLLQQLLPMACGFLIAAVPLAVYQWCAFSSPIRSGYSFTGESTAFSPADFVQHLPFVLRMRIPRHLGFL